MASKSVANSMLVLRIFALAASTATVALIVTNNVRFGDNTELKFQDAIAFRYVLSVAAIAAAYGLVQLPFALYYAAKEKRLIPNGFFPDFDFYGDKIISLLLGTGVGAGIAVAFEFKKVFNKAFGAAGFPKNDPVRTTANKYFDRGIIASAVLAAAFFCMALVSVISSINRNRSKGIFS